MRAHVDSSSITKSGIIGGLTKPEDMTSKRFSAHHDDVYPLVTPLRQGHVSHEADSSTIMIRYSDLECLADRHLVLNLSDIVSSSCSGLSNIWAAYYSRIPGTPYDT